MRRRHCIFAEHSHSRCCTGAYPGYIPPCSRPLWQSTDWRRSAWLASCRRQRCTPPWAGIPAPCMWKCRMQWPDRCRMRWFHCTFPRRRYPWPCRRCGPCAEPRRRSRLYRCRDSRQGHTPRTCRCKRCRSRRRRVNKSFRPRSRWRSTGSPGPSFSCRHPRHRRYRRTPCSDHPDSWRPRRCGRPRRSCRSPCNRMRHSIQRARDRCTGCRKQPCRKDSWAPYHLEKAGDPGHSSLAEVHPERRRAKARQPLAHQETNRQGSHHVGHRRVLRRSYSGRSPKSCRGHQDPGRSLHRQAVGHRRWLLSRYPRSAAFRFSSRCWFSDCTGTHLDKVLSLSRRLGLHSSGLMNLTSSQAQ
jgi:hypothetical protein